MSYQGDEYSQHVDDYELESQLQRRDISFWCELVKRYVPVHVLELACGSGRIGLELLHHSENIYLEGLDINQDMLAAYKNKLGKEIENLKNRIVLHHGDMCTYDFEQRGKFDLIFLPFNSVGHLCELQQQLDAFQKAYDHLAPGGRFVVDVLLPRSLSADVSPHINTIESPDGKFTMVVSSTYRYNRYKQLLSITRIREKFFAKGLSERYLIRINQHIFSPRELQLLFLITGFEIEAIYGDYSWTPFERETGTQQIVIGHKPNK